MCSPVRQPQRHHRECSFGAATARPPGFSCSTGGFAVNALHVGGGVMVRANWSRIASRNRMRRQGVEDRKGKSLVASQSPKQPRRKLSKAELREQAEAASSGPTANSTQRSHLRQRHQTAPIRMISTQAATISSAAISNRQETKAKSDSTAADI